MGAALHFDLSVHNFGIQEYMPHTPETDRVFPHAYSFKDGFMHPGDAPGLGRPDLPILVGGSAKPGTAGPAVRFADEYNALFGTLDQVRERKQLLDEACERGGRDPSTLRYSLMAPCVIGRNEQEVLESARRIGARFGRSPEDVLERDREHGPVGTIAQAVERLKQIEEIGYERVMLQHLAHDDLETVALIGRELAPAVA